MKRTLKVMAWVAVAALLVGCSRFSGMSLRKASYPTTAVELQELNLEMLNGLIENLDMEIAAVKKAAKSPYPMYEQIRAADLEGMQARRDLLVLLRDHCRFARQKLREAEKHPERKVQILEEWRRHRERMDAKLDAADQKIDRLERRRIKLEFDLIERVLEKE